MALLVGWFLCKYKIDDRAVKQGNIAELTRQVTELSHIQGQKADKRTRYDRAKDSYETAISLVTIVWSSDFLNLSLFKPYDRRFNS